MSVLFVIGQILSVIFLVLGVVILLLEVGGRRLYFTAPFIRETDFEWSATNIAIVGVSAAVLTIAWTLAAPIVIVPGFITLNPGRGLEPVFGLLFGLPGAFGGVIANPIYDILTGKLTLGSISGAITAGMSIYAYYRIVGPDWGLKKRKGYINFFISVVVAALVFKAIGIAGWLDAINVMPAETAWYAAFPALLATHVSSHIIVGLILVKLLYAFVDRLGLTPEAMEGGTEFEE